MRHVGEGKKTEPWSSTRYLRRHAAKNLARSQSRDKHTDRAIDRVLDLEEEAQGQFERVGLKFKPVEGAGE